MRSVAAIFGFFSIFSVAACSGAPASSSDDSAAEGVSAATSGFFLSTGPGLTDGIGVKAVNVTSTTCPGGKKAALCTIAQIDFASTNLSDADQKTASDAFLAGHALIKGTLGTVSGDPAIKVSEVWMGQTNADVSNLWGDFYQVASVECSQIAGTACPEASEMLLGKTATSPVAAVDFSGLDAKPADLDQAKTAMVQGNLIVAGTNQGVSRQTPSLIVAEIYAQLGAGAVSGGGAAEGAMCAGIAGIACADGLVCDMGSQQNVPDASGTCRKQDCRELGCGGESSCQVCWANYACVPKGALC